MPPSRAAHAGRVRYAPATTHQRPYRITEMRIASVSEEDRAFGLSEAEAHRAGAWMLIQALGYGSMWLVVLTVVDHLW